jgi:hypothetical protein
MAEFLRMFAIVLSGATESGTTELATKLPRKLMWTSVLNICPPTLKS